MGKYAIGVTRLSNIGSRYNLVVGICNVRMLKAEGKFKLVRDLDVQMNIFILCEGKLRRKINIITLPTSVKGKIGTANSYINGIS